jgi:glycosyltransferase involved in cell wall biosynthesis
MQALVSVLIPCFNGERWISQAIESALSQSWPLKEVIVIDDGSMDGSLDVIRRFDGRIRWETGPNRGGNAARNRLLELANGSWIQYLDADDYLLPDKISRQMDFIAGHLDADAVFGPVTLEHWSESGARQELLPIPQLDDLWVLLARWWLPQTGAALWRKQTIFDIGGWKPDQPCCQEHELYLRALIAGKRLLYCSANGAVYRQWSDSTVCRRDISEVHRQRLAIEDRLEAHLKGKNLLTTSRRNAINQARFEVARIAWEYDPAFSSAVMRTVRQSQPSFRPTGAAAPWTYRVCYRYLGFARAQNISSGRRRLFGVSADLPSEAQHR